MIENNKEKLAIQWLSNEIKQIPNFYKKGEIQESITLNNRKAPPLCDLVLYKYNAAVGNTNGYWDKFPLVLIVRPLEDHFFGLNDIMWQYNYNKTHSLTKTQVNTILNREVFTVTIIYWKPDYCVKPMAAI